MGGGLAHRLLCYGRFLHLLDHFVEVHALRPLARRILFERFKKFRGAEHSRDVEEHVVYSPIVIGVGSDVGPLIGVRAKNELPRSKLRGIKIQKDPVVADVFVYIHPLALALEHSCELLPHSLVYRLYL
jgi:hypothetical protein